MLPVLLGLSEADGVLEVEEGVVAVVVAVRVAELYIEMPMREASGVGAA